MQAVNSRTISRSRSSGVLLRRRRSGCSNAGSRALGARMPSAPRKRSGLGDLLRAGIFLHALDIGQLSVSSDLEADGAERTYAVAAVANTMTRLRARREARTARSRTFDGGIGWPWKRWKRARQSRPRASLRRCRGRRSCRRPNGRRTASTPGDRRPVWTERQTARQYGTLRDGLKRIEQPPDRGSDGCIAAGPPLGPWSEIRVRVQSVEDGDHFLRPAIVDQVDRAFAVELGMAGIEPGPHFLVRVVLIRGASRHRPGPT